MPPGWRTPPAGTGWSTGTIVTVAGLMIAFANPVAGLVTPLLIWPAEALVAWRAPDGYRNW